MHHDTFSNCFVVFFLDLKKTAHVTEMTGIISDFLSWNLQTCWWRQLTKQSSLQLQTLWKLLSSVYFICRRKDFHDEDNNIAVTVTKLPFFQKLTPHPHIYFHLKSFLWKGPLTVKVRKKSWTRFWATSVFVLKYVHI